MNDDPKIYFAIDNCFASKRWTKPEDWSRLIRSLGIFYIEASADTECDPLYMGREYAADWRERTKNACEKAGVHVINVYSGHGTYSTLGLTHWDARVRERFRDGWIKAQIDTAAALGAGLGFFAHAMDDSCLQDREEYQRTLEQLYDDLAELAAYGRTAGISAVSLEQMYSPHQPPWTISGAKELLRRIYERGGNPFYLTDDVGHMNGQQYFLPPTEKDILELYEQKRKKEPGRRIWLGSRKAYDCLRCALEGKYSISKAVPYILEDCEANPHLFAGERDGNVYTWLEETACYSPIIHLQQSDGKSSPHWAFDKVHNEKGIIDGRKVLEAVRESYRKPLEEGMPPRCGEIALTLEPFIGTAGDPYTALEEIADSVEYWRRFIPKDGLRLSELC